MNSEIQKTSENGIAPKTGFKKIAENLQQTIANSILKQKLADKFDFKKIVSFNLIASSSDDYLKISGFGIERGKEQITHKESDNLKLSENPESVNFVMAKIGNYVPMHLIKEIHNLEVTIYFDIKKMEGIVRYLNNEGEKRRREFNSVF